jgi:N-acetyl-beta-hexosaminidase|tara:strand:- start:4563 stop:5387 length:825 start_codon:yes stop_codon:yes gene_type:complete
MPIATGMLLASTLAQAGFSAGMSFGQAAKQDKLRKEAETEAGKKMDAARSRLEKNFMESLSVPKGVFDATMEALNSVAFTALDAAREGSQRGVGTVAQNVLNSQNDALRDVQSEREKQLFNLEAATAEEESRLRDARASLDLQEAEGAQMAAADATEARNDAIQQGIGAVTEGIGTGLEGASLYAVDKANQKAALQGQYDDAKAKGLSTAKDSDSLINPSAYGRGKDFGKGFKPRDYRKAKRSYDFTNPDYNRRYAKGMESYYNFGFGGPIDGQ